MLLAHARHALLLQELELRGSVRSRELADRLDVSEATIRRDIVELESAGRLVRVHGGAVPRRDAARPTAARRLIGVLIPADTPHFLDIVRGMEQVAEELRVRLVLGVTQYRAELEAELEAWLTALPVPIVVLERHLGASGLRRLDHVRTDHEHGAAIAVEHLAGLGHRSVALAAYEGTATAATVQRGWRDAVERLGLEPALWAALPKGSGDLSDLRAALAQFLDACLADGVRAALVHPDQHAAHLVEVAAERGVRVPQDLALVAYDDNFAHLAPVPLTAVTSPRQELGEQSLRLLTERLAATGPATPRHVALLPRLAVRDSCGART